MKIIHTTALTDQQKNQVRSLVEICKQKAPVSLSAPSEDGLDYFLAYDHEDSLAGFLFLYFTDDQICECTAFTAPDHRKQGVFTKLLNMALDAADAYEKEEKTQVDFCFLIDENTPSAMAVMELLEAEYWYSEYKMARACRPEDRNYLTDLQILEKQDAETGVNIYEASAAGTVIGSCGVLPFEKEDYFFHFEIREDYRGKGYGKTFLLAMLSLLYKEGHQVTLQVSGQNFIARKLYKKTGFQTVETLSYYRY